MKRMKRDGFTGVFRYEDENCVTDGSIVLALKEELDLPPVTGMNLDTFFADAPRCSCALALPSLADVRGDLKMARTYRGIGEGEQWRGRLFPGKKRTLYNFGDGCPVVNLELLRDVLEALPGARAWYKAATLPIYFEAENGRALLYPVRPEKQPPATPPVEVERPEIISNPADDFTGDFTPAEFAVVVSLEPLSPDEFAALLAA